MNSQEAEEAMPLDEFLKETIAELGTDADEILVERSGRCGRIQELMSTPFVIGLNQHMVELFSVAGSK